MKQLTDAFGRRLEKYGITRIQWIAMFYLDEAKELSQRELGIHMNIKDSTVARLLDRMERDGLVERLKTGSDRRVSTVTLSEQGQTLWQQIMPEGEAFSRQSMEGISPEDQETFDRVLAQMVENSLRNTPEK